MKHLWEIDHAYYCNLGNYYTNDCGLEYESLDDFLEEWGDAEMDYNLLFRWDWKEADPEDERFHDELRVFWILQRKGIYNFCQVKVNKEDESRVLEFLKPRWEYMKALWQPISI